MPPTKAVANQLTDEDKKNIVEVAQATSLTLAEIGVALELDCTVKTVHMILKAAKVERRSTGNKRGRKSKAPEQQKDENDDPMGDDSDDVDDEPASKQRKLESDEDDGEEKQDEEDSNDSMDDKESDASSEHDENLANHSDTGMDPENQDQNQASENLKNQEEDPKDQSEELDEDEPSMDITESNKASDADESTDGMESDILEESLELDIDEELQCDDMDDTLPLGDELPLDDKEPEEELVPEEKKPLPAVTLYWPGNAAYDFTKWTAAQVYEWLLNFLPAESANRIHCVRATGQWLYDVYTGQHYTRLLSRTEQMETFLHLDLVCNSFLLLKPDGSGALNTLSNLLFLCYDFRVLFDGNGAQDESKKTIQYATEIFLRESDSSKRLRNFLEKKRGVLGVGEMFDAFLENVQKEFSHNPFTTLEHQYYIQEKCDTCHTAKFQEDKGGEVMKTRLYSTLKIRKGSFKESLKLQYPPVLSSRRCKWCDGKIWKTLETENTGKYHFMKIRGEKIKDLDFDSRVDFFGAKWRIRAMAEKKMGEFGEKYVAWMCSGEKWICVADDGLLELEKEGFKDLDTQIMLWEKC